MPSRASNARTIGRAARIEQQQDPPAGFEVPPEHRQLLRQEVVHRPGDDHQVGVGGHCAGEQVHAVDGEALLVEAGNQAPDAARVATWRPLAVADGEDRSAPPATNRLQDAARERLLGVRRDDDPPPVVLDHRAAVLGDAIAPGSLGIPVEVVERPGDEGVLRAETRQQARERLAFAAAVEDRDGQRRLHVGEHLTRGPGEGKRPRGRQIETAVRSLRQDLQQHAPEDDERRLDDEPCPALRRPPRPPHRSPRHRRESSASSVNARNAAMNRTR